MEADDDGTFARLDGFRDEDVGRDGVGVMDALVGGGVDIEGGEFLLDGCDDGGIHCWLLARVFELFADGWIGSRSSFTDIELVNYQGLSQRKEQHYRRGLLFNIYQTLLL